MAIRFPRFTAGKRKAALVEAEKEFACSDKKRGKQKYVMLRTSQITEKLVLFQPREFSYGAHPVDPKWVNELSRRIGIHGELDPVLVIRIGKDWVCVDGHHRIAAYRVKKHKKPIRCEWFAGTPTEAVDECMQRNKKDHLPIPNADRREEAWRRVLLDQGSKKEVSQACGVGPSTVANMRKARRRYEEDPEFATRVGRPLLDTSWGVMLIAAHDVEDKEYDLQERASSLARNMRGRLSDLLSVDPVVTAYALAKYDARLPKALMDTWHGRMAAPSSRPLTPPEMKKQAAILRQRADAIETMLAKQEEDREVRLEEARERERRADEVQAKLRLPKAKEKRPFSAVEDEAEGEPFEL